MGARPGVSSWLVLRQAPCQWDKLREIGFGGGLVLWQASEHLAVCTHQQQLHGTICRCDTCKPC